LTTRPTDTDGASRREFFCALGRNCVLGVLALGTALLASKRPKGPIETPCARAFRCKSCPELNVCARPQGLLARDARIGG
jgi:hypothetical protein